MLERDWTIVTTGTDTGITTSISSSTILRHTTRKTSSTSYRTRDSISLLNGDKKKKKRGGNNHF